MLAEKRRETDFVDRVEDASRARFEGRPIYKIGDVLAPMVPAVEGVWGVKDRTIVEISDSVDPDKPLIEESYVVTAPDRAWFVALVSQAPSARDRVRRYAHSRGIQAYWPRSVRLVRRGRGTKKEVVIVRPLFQSYVLVHLPANTVTPNPKRKADAQVWRTSPAFGLLTSHEAEFNGISGMVSVNGHPLSVPDVLVERIVARERRGDWNKTIKKGKRVVAALPEWVCHGALVRVVDGPFASFTALVEDIDEVKGRLKVVVDIFGRATPIELGVEQVAPVC